ncbi:INCE protein, partial [Rhadina sibilatrix]|nr:INCE protein [Rhadina sibilatrix]
IKDFIKRNTPTRLHLKPEFFLQEKERQRLENLRKKQEAEEQRKKKVEEEKRRRQAEMKQKREERLRKALQARERAEQMEEKKKKRVEQKIRQSDEKVNISQVREEKVAEERSKRKGSKKHGEAEAQKQKALRWSYRVFLLLLQEENEQQEPLQKREDEVKERGKTVLELKNLLEQQQLGQAKERSLLECERQRYMLASLNSCFSPRDPKQRGKKPPQAQQEPAVVTGKATKVGREGKCGLRGARLDLSRDRTRRGEKTYSTSSPWDMAEQSRQVSWLSQVLPQRKGGQRVLRVGVKAQSPVPVLCCSLKDAQGPESPSATENSYGLDLNSDDSTDDESNPRKPIPAWADGAQLQEAIVHQYYHPVDVDALFGAIPSPKLEDIFYKNKPRYFKRTSSAVWHSPP